jgi:hypothetical protein
VNVSDEFAGDFVAHQSPSSVCRKYLLVQVLSSVIEQTVVNVTDSLQRRTERERVVCVQHQDLSSRNSCWSMAIESLVGLGLRNVEVSHSEKPHSVEILWTRDRSNAEISTYTTHKTNSRQTYMSSVRFEPEIPGSELS